MMAIQTNGLVRRFDDLTAVNQLSLTVGRGEMFGLVGPDGAGKTTTIRMLTGVLPPDDGAATILGYDLVHDTAEIKKRIGYLSQIFSLYGDLSIDENIEFFAQIHNVRDFKTRREELLEFTRLKQFRKRLADRLSGGMKQKLALACTLIHEPELIFLDEPTTGVDPVSRRDFWLILADLLRRNITIVMTSPYLDEAERCQRVGLMHKGLLLRCDTPRGIVQDLKETLLEITCDAPHKAYEVLKNDQGWESAQLFGEKIHLLSHNPAERETKLRDLFQRAGIEVLDVRPTSPSLEDAFIELVRRDTGSDTNTDESDTPS